MSSLFKLSRYMRPRCPHCFEHLQFAAPRRYETSEEHACDPNMETHPLRPTMTCSCELGKFGYWDYEGSGFYVTGDYREFEKKFPRKKYLAGYAGIFSFDWFHAIDMWFYWHFGRGKKWLKKIKKLLNEGKKNG